MKIFNCTYFIRLLKNIFSRTFHGIQVNIKQSQQKVRLTRFPASPRLNVHFFTSRGRANIYAPEFMPRPRPQRACLHMP